LLTTETKRVEISTHELKIGHYTLPPCDLKSEDFSSVNRLLRITALVMRFIGKLKKRCDLKGPITSNEIENAESVWISHVQRKHYLDVIDAVNLDKRHTMISQLGLYLDSKGLLICRGRLENAEISDTAKHPLLLPKHDAFTKLIVDKTHRQLLHAGVSQTLSHTRQKYWIPQGRQCVKGVLRTCKTCQRYEGGPYKMPEMPALPKDRVTVSPPFTKTGLDYLGPLYVKTQSGTKNTWVCLVTCLVTRDVHLELMPDMSTEQFLLGLRRFIARYGKPQTIISDNASQFKLASETIHELSKTVITDADVITYIANTGIQWNFIVELAPWMGGFYERLVGLVKRSLRKSIGKVCLTNEQLLTLLQEVEAVLNSRPLVFVGDDIDSSEILTPSHFLTLNPKIGIPHFHDYESSDDDEYDPNLSSSRKLLQLWKKGQTHLNRFWKIWRDDYLLSLRERYQKRLKSSRVQSSNTPRVGDVVLVKEDTPRGCWRIGRIIELTISHDGQTRSAKVLLTSGRRIGRPLNLLYPIECPGDSAPIDPVIIKQTGGPAETRSTDHRPERGAAQVARMKIQEQLKRLQEQFGE
ncbi:MAG: hypothetical protein ABW185_28910, partial [Sedimenticola sp.]